MILTAAHPWRGGFGGEENTKWPSQGHQRRKKKKKATGDLEIGRTAAGVLFCSPSPILVRTITQQYFTPLCTRHWNEIGGVNSKSHRGCMQYSETKDLSATRGQVIPSCL